MRLGLIVATVTLLLDQASKLYLIDLMQRRGPVEVTPFFNLVMVWNRGVSFGLFNDHSTPELQRWLLAGLAGVLSVVLLVWLRKAEQPLLRVALGLVIGGAIGNMIDRMAYGAVADFFDFHVAGWHWPAFNIADSGIVVGVALLFLDGLFGAPGKPKI